MRKIGTIELEILDLAVKEKGTFNETNLENSNLKRLGVGKILDTLAALKDRKMILLNGDGSFSITDLAREILWNSKIPLWARILRLLQIKSCSMKEISNILEETEEEINQEMEKLRKNQFVLMSPQRINEAIIKIFEILPEGIAEIDKTETEGFEKMNFERDNQSIEILSKIDEIQKEVQDSQMEFAQKESIVKKLVDLKNKLEI